MRRVIFPLMALSLAAIPVALDAQAPRAQRGAAAERGAVAAQRTMVANPAARVLQHRDELGLNLEQVRQLQQLEAQHEQRTQPLREQLQAARPDFGPALRERARQHAGAGMTPEQRAELREQMQARMQVRMKAQRGAGMTPEQRAEMREQMQAQRGAAAGFRHDARPVSPELRAQLEALRPVAQQLREATVQTRQEVAAVLTAEQTAQLRALQQARAGELRARWGGEARPRGGEVRRGPGRGR
jgi:Spy/CpxP family protein refolding chaperone